MFYLIREVHDAAGTNEVVQLAQDHKVCLEEAITRMQR
jgi:hypothetical protein